MPWTFVVPNGLMLAPDGSNYGAAYSGGDLGARPDAVDNVADEPIPDVGPLPAGWYTMVELVRNSHLGPTAIRLEPDPDTQMFGRSGFYIHWRKHAEQQPSSSLGCIAMDDGTLIEPMWNNGDRRLLVSNET